jgi:oligoribonuclease
MLADNLKTEKSNRLIWIDMEMTGLDPVKDRVLEIASIITDNDLNIIAQGPELVVHQRQEMLDGMDVWCKKVHSKSGLSQKVMDSSIDEKTAEQLTLDFLQQHCKPLKDPLCGNSVWMDRVFMMHHMPKLYNFLHYRTVDVSSIKELVKRWLPEVQEVKDGFKKKNVHRALEDIVESIEELKFYRQFFGIQKQTD